MSRITIIFLCLYMVVATGDAWSTHLAASTGLGQEFNPVMADGTGGMSDSRYWIINVLFGLAITGLLEWALRMRHFAAEQYLKNPLRLVLNLLYLNPFSTRNKPKAVIQYLALPLCLLAVKAFVICSNLSIAQGHSGFLDSFVMWLSQYLQGGILYAVAVSAMILPIWTASLYVTAHILKAEKEPRATGFTA